ncbi:hypothetical protein DJ031_00475 [bacterium endosymbiont of Escarpia laminata]|nr:MAG: hypothetical protein DJ031_00475 [bacterium endosymbiont of Escarpia laminata]
MASQRKKLQEVYFDPAKVGSYGGLASLRRVDFRPIERVPRKIVEQWLSEQNAYTLHKPVRVHFKRRRVFVGGRNQQWQADLVDVSSLKKENDGTTFLLTVIDVFSKVARCVPLKNKSATSVSKALEGLFTNDGVRPLLLQTDRGLEFFNRSVRDVLEKYGIQHFSTYNEETKASVVERFNRTLKTRMWRYLTHKETWRYIDILPDLVRTYNDTPHRSIEMAPSQVDDTNQEEVWQRLYGGHHGKGMPKYHVADRVRISKVKRRFDKGYMANWTEEIFTIREVHPSDPPVYRLTDDLGEILDGTFYEPELQKVTVPIDKLYRVESIVQRRKVGRRREVLVKWFGYPSKFNSWIDAKGLVGL